MSFIGILIIVIFSSILYVKILPILEQEKLEERRGKLKAVVNTVVSLMDYYEKEVIRKESWKQDPSQPKTIEEAKKFVIKNLREMRYDKIEYFFILDGKGTMIMNPLKPEEEGKNMLNEKDRSGNKIFRDMVIGAQRDGETFVSFIWQSKYSPDIYESRTTYSKYYWPWDWVISSEVYTQDIIESMEQIRYRSAIYILLTTLIALGLLAYFIHKYLNVPLQKIVYAIKEINKDNLEYRIKPLFLDELGQISNQFNTMIINRKKNQEEKLRAEREHSTLKKFNASLEQKVKQRTAQLEVAKEKAELAKEIAERAKQEIEKLNKTKDEFLANLSHEIKTPLTIVSAYSEMLSTGEDYPEEVKEYSSEIYTHSQMLNNYISDIIFVTEIESKIQLRKSDIPLKTLFLDIIKKLKPFIEEKEIQLDLNVSENVLIHCDQPLMEKALSAIVKNAIVYNKPKGRIDISNDVETDNVDRTHCNVSLHIIDTGIGISSEYHEKVFEKFFRVDSSLTYTVSGVGVGLFIATKVIELHEGKIELTSEIGQGTEVKIHLPIGKVI